MPLFSSIFVLLLGIFVWYRNRAEKVNNIFFLNCLAIAMWFFGTYQMFIAVRESSIMFWNRFIYVGVVFLPTFMYHLAVVFAHKEKEKKNLLWGAYIFSFFFLGLSQTNLFLNGIYYYPDSVHGRAQIFHHLFLICFLVYLLLFFRVLYDYYKKCQSPIIKNQTKYIIISFYVLAFSIIGFLPAYGIYIYPIFYLLGVFFAIICAYAILRYRLLNPRFVISRSIIYFMMVLFVAVSFSFLALVVSGQYFSMLDATKRLLLTLVIAFIVVLGLEPLKNFLAVTTDRIFFKNRIDYDQVLDDLSHIINEEIDLKKLIEHICQEAQNKLRLKEFKIFIFHEKRKTVSYFEFLPTRTKLCQEKLNFNKVVAEYFLANPRPLVLEEFLHEIQAINDPTLLRDKRRLKNVVTDLEKLKMQVVAPVILEGKLIALIGGGVKLSGDSYHVKDLNVLSILAAQFSAALEKARLYDDSKQFGEKLKKEVEQATKELREANIHLQELDRAKTEFISIASHQLRTPLSGIKGYLSMMLEGDFGQIPEEQKKVLTSVLSNSDRLVRLVNIFLNISRIESGRLRLEKSEFDLVMLAKEAVEQMSADTKGKNLSIVFKDHPEKMVVCADRDKIYDVLLNFLDNAVKYTPTGKIIVRMFLNKTKDKVTVTVTDTGIGIPSEELDELFVKFRRGKKIAQINTSGAGLGLFIAKKIIELHGGDIWAHSKGEDRGSEFGFEINLQCGLENGNHIHRKEKV